MRYPVCGHAPTINDIATINPPHVVSVSTATAQTKYLLHKGGKLVFSTANARLFIRDEQ